MLHKDYECNLKAFSAKKDDPVNGCSGDGRTTPVAERWESTFILRQPISECLRVYFFEESNFIASVHFLKDSSVLHSSTSLKSLRVLC